MDIKTNYSAQPAVTSRSEVTEQTVPQRLESTAGRTIEKTERAEPSQPQLQEAVSTLQDFTQSIQRNLNFSIDDSTGRMVVKVTDSVSGDVIRQLPTEEALRLAESLDEMRSLLFEARA